MANKTFNSNPLQSFLAFLTTQMAELIFEHKISKLVICFIVCFSSEKSLVSTAQFMV